MEAGRRAGGPYRGRRPRPADGEAGVEAGRRYVHAYVEYIRYVETLHELLHRGVDAHTPAVARTEP